MFLFTSELTDLLAGDWRLQKDGSWRSLSRGTCSLQDTDFTTENPGEIAPMRRTTIPLGGTTYDIDPEMWSPPQPVLHHASRVFRKDYPDEPLFDRLREVIAAGSNKTMNRLILNVHGEFELRQKRPSSFDPTIVVKFEAFPAKGGYVGSKAAKDENYLQDIYLAAMLHWRDHLKSGKTQLYDDTYAAMATPDVRQELKEINANWKPGY